MLLCGSDALQFLAKHFACVFIAMPAELTGSSLSSLLQRALTPRLPLANKLSECLALCKLLI